MVKFKLKTFHVTHDSAGDGRVVASSEDAVALFRTIFTTLDQDREHFVVACLNVRGRVVGYKVVSSGGFDTCRVDLPLIFQAALLFGSTRLIVAHNHPSGIATPSMEDVALTKRIRAAGRVLEMTVDDHLILSSGGCFSFRDNDPLAW